ncbi:MAG: hypothetical protein HQL65_10300 [Magnetococcales bacterium]|nr:hypothetical protein [Magnetococcales bacterium]
MLYIKKTLIWGEIDGTDLHYLEWDWIGFLRHLSVAWPYLTCEQDYPAIFNFHREKMPTHPGQFQACVERHWRENRNSPNQQQQEEALFDFLHLHDLSSGLPDTGIDSLVLLRQGKSLLIGSGHQNWLLNWQQCMDALAKFGDQIALRVEHIDDARLQDILTRWHNRDQIDPILKWQLAANDDDSHAMINDALGTDCTGSA